MESKIHKVSKLCLWCRNEFWEWPSEMKKRTYCSRSCSSKALMLLKKQQLSPAYKGGGILTTCGYCNKSLTVPKYRIKKAKYGKVFCNRHCHYDWMSDHLTRENALAWKGGNPQPKYPSKFNKRLKEMIRERDGYCCKGCGKTNEEEYRNLHKNLCIHHIDYNRDNLDLSNLVTVCTCCNVTANTKSQRIKWMNFYSSLLLC